MIFDNSKCIWKWKKGECGYRIPDSVDKCTGKCKNYSEYHWDNKFGMIDSKGNSIMEDNYTQRAKETANVVIEGVGKNAEIISNADGGKQSKSPMAMHLVDPYYLEDMFMDLAEQCEYVDESRSACVDPEDMDRYACYRAIEYIASYMKSGVDFELTLAMDSLCDDEVQQVINIAKILQYGADRYEPNNWRLIPQENHINHALVHIIAHLAGDTQDDHINHALCRLMMAKATKTSEGFAYGAYVKKEDK